MLTLSPGDHIRVWRGTYYHHGIFAGTASVVHFTDVRNSKAAASVQRSTIDEFAGGARLERVEYRNCLPAVVVLQRANASVGRRGYNVFSNNCEHFARWCKVGDHASEQVRRAGAGTAGAGLSWGAAALGIQSLPALAASHLAGSAQTMSGLRSVGAALGGGAKMGAAMLAVLPAVVATTAVRAIYADDLNLSDDERATRERARKAGTVGAVAGGALSLAALSSKGSLGASGMTSVLKLVGRGRMAAGLATLIASPAVLALVAGVVVYQLAKRSNQTPTLPQAGF